MTAPLQNRRTDGLLTGAGVARLVKVDESTIGLPQRDWHFVPVQMFEVSSRNTGTRSNRAQQDPGTSRTRHPKPIAETTDGDLTEPTNLVHMTEMRHL